MRELSQQEIVQVEGAISKTTLGAGARLLGRAFLGGIMVGSGIGLAVGVVMIGYDVYKTLE